MLFYNAHLINLLNIKRIIQICPQPEGKAEDVQAERVQAKVRKAPQNQEVSVLAESDTQCVLFFNL